MNCKKAQNKIPLYLAPHKSWLKPEERKDLKSHLVNCAVCRQELEELMQTVLSLRQHWEVCEDTVSLRNTTGGKESSHPRIRVPGKTRRIIAVASV